MAEPVKSVSARGSGLRPGGMLVALGVSLALLVLFYLLSHPHL
jgi:hypothetical protein